MRIRAYAPSDHAAVIDLWHTCGLTRPWNDPVRDIERKLTVQPELFLVGELEGALIGSVMGGYDGHRGWLYYLAVAPEHRRGGHGRALVQTVCDRLESMGCPKVELMIRADNMQAHAFYRSLRFEVQEVDVVGLRLIADD